MGVLDFLSKMSNKAKQYKYLKMMNGGTPVFNDFGNNIYASDIVQNCIHCLATEMSKLQPKHICTDNKSGVQRVVNDEINRLLKYGPNPLMTTTDFLEAITYLREINKNVFIYLKYDEINYKDGQVGRKYIGLYPLNPLAVEFIQDISDKIYIKLYFGNFESYTLPFEDIILWRKDYGANEFLGGDINGKPNNDALLKLLKTSDTIIQGLEKGVKAGFNIRGLLKINSLVDAETQEKHLKEFEEKISRGESGIAITDVRNEFLPMNIDPKIIDKDTIQFIDTRILNNYGVSLPIFNGDFTEEQYQSFYEKTLEPMILSLGRLFTKALFTQREIDVGNEIIFYAQGLLYTNLKNKISAVNILSNRGVLTDNQILAMFGYPPFDGGDVRHISLNFINRDIADQYQMNKTTDKEVKKDG